MADYLDPKTLAKISRLDLRAKYVVEGFISGMHKSPYHGYSVEFAQHRGYVAGDDLRHLDWKVWGKSERYYIKQYEAETNLVTTILLDVSESMAYAGRAAAGGLSKLEYAKLGAAALAFFVLQQSDAVAAGVFSDKMLDFAERSTRQAHIHRICRMLETAKAGGPTNVAAILHRVAQENPRRGIVFLVSDLFEDADVLLPALRHLRHVGHEVVVIQVLDNDEVEFPFAGMTQFRGLELPARVLCNPRAIKKSYLEALHRHVTRVKAACQRNGVDYFLANTKMPVDVALSAYLAKRRHMERGGSGRGSPG